MNDDFAELYDMVIRDHSKRPRNYGEIPGAIRVVGDNPSCGDEIQLDVKFGAGDIIEDTKFIGKACAICTASASLMTMKVKGKQLSEAVRLMRNFHTLVTSDAEADTNGLGDAVLLRGVRKFPQRVKCATLAWRAFEQALGDGGDREHRVDALGGRLQLRSQAALIRTNERPTSNPRQAQVHPPVHDFTDDESEQFLELADPTAYSAGDLVVKQGEPGNCMFYVAEGNCRVVVKKGSDLVELATLGQGEIFGELAMFDHQPRCADVTALENCVLLKVNEGVLRALAGVFPAAAFKFLLGIVHEMGERVRSINSRYVDSILARL